MSHCACQLLTRSHILILRGHDLFGQHQESRPLVALNTGIAQFRYFKIQPQTIDFSTRLWGINYRVCGVYSPEPRTEVYCFRLNFKISKVGYSATNRLIVQIWQIWLAENYRMSTLSMLKNWERPEVVDSWCWPKESWPLGTRMTLP